MSKQTAMSISTYRKVEDWELVKERIRQAEDEKRIKRLNKKEAKKKNIIVPTPSHSIDTVNPGGSYFLEKTFEKLLPGEFGSARKQFGR